MLAVEEATNSPPTNIPMRVLQILRQVWADKIIQPRVKTFAWRLLRLALVVAYICPCCGCTQKTCSCCGGVENEIHMFFQCSYICQDSVVFFRDWNSSSCSAFFKSWASRANYDNIAIRTITSNYRYDFSSLWCLWKSCNDRFNNIHWSPARVLHETRAIDMSCNVALVKDMTPSDPLIQSSHHHPNSQGTLQS